MSKHQYWFAADAIALQMPTFFFEIADGYFYGFPAIGDRGLKVSRHSGGVSHPAPVELDSLVDSEDEAAARRFLAKHLPFCSDQLLSQQACMYTLSPDEHFVVDRHPEYDRVVFAAGLSGHGFKFTSVLGQIMAELAMESRVMPEIQFLGLQRFGA